MLDRIDERTARRSVECFANAAHERRGNRGAFASGDPLRCASAPKLALQNSDQRRAILHAMLVRRESRIGGKTVASQHAHAEKLEVAIGSRTDRKRPVACVKELIRHDGGMRIPVTLRLLSSDQDALRNIDERCDARTE